MFVIPQTTPGLQVRTADLCDQILTRRLKAEAAIQSAQRRYAELRDLTEQARQRREQLRTDREKLRAQLALRRSLLNTPDRRAAAAILEAAVQVTGMSLRELWLEYFALGGDASIQRLEAMLAGRTTLTRGDHDRVAMVLNERLEQAGWGRPLAYWDGSR